VVHFCSARWYTFTPPFTTCKSRYKILEDSLNSDENRGQIRSEIILLVEKINKLEPPKIDFENYLWFIYCKGIESDLSNGLIQPESNCSTCSGSGKVLCNICGGSWKVGFYITCVDVIDVDSVSRKEFRRNELDKRKQKTSIRRKRDSIVDNGPLGFGNGFEMTRREKVLKEKEKKSRERNQKMKERAIANKTIKCCICKTHGWNACPKCVLVEQPTYLPSAKMRYISRWPKQIKWL
jgi:hypothetical protein